MTAIRRDGRTGTAFSEWVRSNPRLDSRNFGVCNQDIDWIWHKYKLTEDGVGSREVNHVLLIEEKANGADLSFPERDTMLLLHQALRMADRKKLRTARNDEVEVRFWGYFKLRYTGTCLVCASEIIWNKAEIELQTLEKILQLEVDPLNLEPYSDRRHHIKRFPLFGDKNIANS